MQILAILGWREYRVSVGTSLLIWNCWWKDHSRAFCIWPPSQTIMVSCTINCGSTYPLNFTKLDLLLSLTSSSIGGLSYCWCLNEESCFPWDLWDWEGPCQSSVLEVLLFSSCQRHNPEPLHWHPPAQCVLLSSSAYQDRSCARGVAVLWCVHCVHAPPVFAMLLAFTRIECSAAGKLIRVRFSGCAGFEKA